MNDIENYWHAVEAGWREKYLEELIPHLTASSRIHKWLSKVALHESFSQPQSQHLQVALLHARRLGEEFRTVELMAENGHGYQAATTACNVFEQSHWLIWICSDSVNAEQIVAWNDEKRQILRIEELVRQSGKSLGWGVRRSDDEYDSYRYLCGFKHNNPKFLRFLHIEPDPDLYLAKFSIAQISFSIMSSFFVLALSFLDPTSGGELFEEWDQIMGSVQPLFPSLKPIS